jgi:hypothetical protein
MVYNLIPPHPFRDKIDQVVDFTFVDKICEPLYSPLGQRPYAPSLKLKTHLVQRYYNISDREMEQKIIGDIYIKRFLGLPITHAKFNHSTIRLDRDRLGAEMFHVCHVYILAQALAQGLCGDGLKKKPSDRIVSVYDPEVRCGHKTKHKSFIGDKVQIVGSFKSHLVLQAEPIARNEADSEALVPLINSVVNECDVRPAETVADSAYGWDRNRERMQANHMRLTAPVPKTSSPAGSLFQNNKFRYIPEEDVVICPAEQKSSRKAHITESQGTEH